MWCSWHWQIPHRNCSLYSPPLMARSNATQGQQCLCTGFKAQCVSYILGKEFGVEVSGYAFETPADFLRTDDPQTIRAELTDIRDTAYDISARMMRSLEQSKAPRLSEQER